MRPKCARDWLNRGLLPNGFTLVGIDEQTALVKADANGAWEVRGRGAVTVIGEGLASKRYGPGEEVSL